MAKYSLETKLKVVNDILELGMSFSDVSRSSHITRSLIRRWVERYKKFGIDGLLMKPRTYSGDFKLHVVKYMHENSMSFCSTAVHFGIPSETTVREWERIYWSESSESLCKDIRGRNEKMSKDKIKNPKVDKQVEEDLIAEVQRLRMENEYLKKLNALVQAREKSAKKTK